MHISSDAVYLREVMDELNLKMNAMCNIGLQPDRLKVQVDTAIEICRKYPRYYSWCTTFGFERMYEPDWTEKVKKYFEDKNGKYLFIATIRRARNTITDH